MSRVSIEKACLGLMQKENIDSFRSVPEQYLSRFALSDSERNAIREGQLGSLFLMDVNYVALNTLARALGFDDEAYVSQLRSAAHLSENPQQLDTLRRRTKLRKG
jgi:hypothetical protein